jgi:uncharacterized protein YbjT (DUF2867 family)
VKILVLGADGFIGRHLAFHLRDQGHDVLAQARHPQRLARMGFATLRADLTDPATHSPDFWRGPLEGSQLISAAGLLTGSDAAFRAVHHAAPKAALAALPAGHHALLISAVGIEADTPFARWRRETEALFAGHAILRPGLVLADTSYGGSSALRAFAALPFLTPVVGNGRQMFNPIHASDLAVLALDHLTSPRGTVEVGGAEALSLTDLTLLIRRWLGLAPQPLLHLPLPFARGLGRLGDALRLGPLSLTAVTQLQTGVLAAPAAGARGVTDFVMARPAGTQDLWQARLYLLKPLIRLTLAVLWLASAALGLTLPADAFPEVAAPPMLARLGGLIDLGLGLTLLRNWQPRLIGMAQLGVVTAYTLGLTLLAPALWLDPYGGLLKNLPILALILIHIALAEER